MNVRQVKLCMVGAGRMANVHAAALAAVPNAQIAAVVDPTEQDGRALAAKLGAAWYSNLSTALFDQKFDGAVIAAPTGLHAEMIETCVKHGLPVFCEKPVDLSLARVDECLQVVKASGVPVLIGFHRRFDSARREIYDLVNSGKVGRIEHILQISRDPKLPSESFISHSGGMVRDMLIHDFDELVWLCGDDRSVTVAADLQRFVDPGLLSPYDDHDSAAISIVFDGGPQCYLAASRRSVYGFEQRIEVFGANGMIACPSVRSGTIEYSDATGTRTPPLLNNFSERYAAAYRAEMIHFLAIITERVQPICTVQDARASLCLAEYVLESSRSGTTIHAGSLGRSLPRPLHR
jgi:myo-inositol 2-dehydrogenase / D-chiro-inositol 1-dehydrogenase